MFCVIVVGYFEIGIEFFIVFYRLYIIGVFIGGYVEYMKGNRVIDRSVGVGFEVWGFFVVCGYSFWSWKVCNLEKIGLIIFVVFFVKVYWIVVESF